MDGFTNDGEFFDEQQGTSKRANKRKKKKEDREARQLARTPKPLKPRSRNQELYVDSIKKNGLTFGIGPAGAGKTYVPAYMFGQMLDKGEIDKIYVARPNVSKSKHKNGYLPGDLKDKTAPWLVPIFEGLKESMGPAAFDRARRDNKIEEVPFEFIQGRTFKDAACIVDEAENLDIDDLYITLTRQGEGLYMVLAGDIKQSRIPNSGLADVVDMAGLPFMEDIGVVEFGIEDIVRSAQAKQWAKAFEMYWKKAANTPTEPGFNDHAPAFMGG